MKITIVGLGQIGASLGLALAPWRQHIQRVGLDKLLPVSGKARSLGALDRIAVNLPSAVQDADMVVLALPLSEIEETFRVIADSLSPETLVIETAPAKRQTTAWADALLPAGQPYAGILPILPAAAGGAALRPRGDLFSGGIWLVAGNASLSPVVWQKIRALASLAGSRTQRTAPETIDRFSLRYDGLPRLLAAALLNATVDQPGWFDARKLAGAPYATASAGLSRPDDDQALAEMLWAHPDLAVLAADDLLTALQSLRDLISHQDAQTLDAWLQAARDRLPTDSLVSGDDLLSSDEALSILVK